ncbi:GtrA family protein [Tahibacter amnicola]|uniref:GtrA family protein n=1 Tax=Tahibacter amnicola TaxID=2976241 RepID=A0ABY6BGS2_9GAMM|nr:GtrA family protein [Tahibacter amnicola]UXI69218.1 GtrA family protein [Tahibacter amnicola]
MAVSGEPANPSAVAPRDGDGRWQFLRFVAVSAVAAGLNFGSRILFDLFTTYIVAISLAFCVGLSSAFVLNRLFVFAGSTNPLHRQATYFVVVNLFGLVQTLAISLLLARWLLPQIGITVYVEEIAHAVGIGVPILTSFLGHKYLSFKVD